jgi:hypothetical protein
MKRPAIIRSSGWIGVPKLRLQNLSTRRIEAAQVLHHGRIVAAQLRRITLLRKCPADTLSTKKYLRATKGELAESPERRHVCRLWSDVLQGMRRIMYTLLDRVYPHGRHFYRTLSYSFEQSNI